MHYYPPALDYAMYILGGVGLICLFRLKFELPSRRRGLIKLGGCALLGFGLLSGGLGGVLFNSRAPLYTATGVFSDVSHASGRNSHTDFYLRVPSGSIGWVSTDGDLKWVVDGEPAEITYQEGSHRVLHLRVLDGPYAGYEHEQGDGSFGAYVALVLALVTIGYGVVNFLSDGTGGPDSEKENATPAPDGDVDTESILKL